MGIIITSMWLKWLDHMYNKYQARGLNAHTHQTINWDQMIPYKWTYIWSPLYLYTCQYLIRVLDHHKIQSNNDGQNTHDGSRLPLSWQNDVLQNDQRDLEYILTLPVIGINYTSVKSCANTTHSRMTCKNEIVITQEEIMWSTITRVEIVFRSLITHKLTLQYSGLLSNPSSGSLKCHSNNYATKLAMTCVIESVMDAKGCCWRCQIVQCVLHHWNSVGHRRHHGTDIYWLLLPTNK